MVLSQSLGFCAESKWISTIETSSLKWYQQERTVNIHTYTSAYKYSWKMENDTLSISWKSLFASINRDDFLSVFPLIYLLLFHNSDGVTDLFFLLNMHLGTMLSSTTFKRLRPPFLDDDFAIFHCRFLPSCRRQLKKWLHLYVRCIYCTASN